MVEWNIASAFNINICIWFNNFPKKEDDRTDKGGLKMGSSGFTTSHSKL
jgi:hypothetical protein